jgi:hypothetical protein
VYNNHDEGFLLNFSFIAPFIQMTGKSRTSRGAAFLCIYEKY